MVLLCPVTPQTLRSTGTGWPSPIACRCPGGTMRSVRVQDPDRAEPGLHRCLTAAALPPELVGVDAGLPAAVRLAGAGPSAGGAPLGRRHATAGQPELRQPGHGSVPEAVSGLHRPVVHLRSQRVSPDVLLRNHGD